MIYWQLFWSFFQIGLFSIGGGYAALPLIQQQIVNVHGWLNLTQFADVVTISQMTPGPIATAAASFVGIKVAGILGSIVATVACVTPSIIIVLILAYFYTKYRNLKTVQGVLKGLRPAVVGLIGSAGLSILALALWNGTIKSFTFSSLDYASIGLFAVSLFALQKYKLNPILLMVATGVVGLALYSFIG